MATYTYKCNNCGKFDYKQPMSDPALTMCPTCESGVQKVFSAPNVTGKAPERSMTYNPNRSVLWNSAQAP